VGLFDWLSDDSSGHPGFFVGKKGPTQPVKFGRDIIVSALDSSQQDIDDICADLKKITSQRPSGIGSRLASNRGIVQMYLITLQSAAVFLYLIREQIPKDVLNSVMEGIKNGFSDFSTNFSAPASQKVNNFLCTQFQICLRALNEEINNADEIDTFNSGTTATLVTDLLAKECKLDNLFQDSDTGALEKIMIERHIAVSGIIFILNVCPKLQITYRS